MLVLMRISVALAAAGVLAAIGVMGQQAASLGIFEKDSDVGKNPKAGSAFFDAGTQTYRVTGGGANMWFKEDAFHFVYRQMTGDLSLHANVAFEGTGTEQHRKAALMIRQSLDPDSAYADIAVHGDGLTSLQYRPSAGVDTAEFRVPMKAARIISIERHGHEITIMASDGVDKPALSGPVIVSMSGPVYVGLAVCSHNAEVLETAVFSKVQVTGGKTAALQTPGSFQLMPEHGRKGLPLP